ncbi:hypothetical protein AK812_SmicGene38157 [Symbiodinium microadriaticum]|uniref:Uncharacterized protein n=1 Tax=Symbiodinium microadriaticum TaxID=2951 RepID=A0A1Q9CEP3_SYMMI|nr:hypothetical protein AK812_SmicGene38157 [Symbiodinium microadriaticum]
MSELNKSLLEAASMLNLEAIQKLLASGADATHIDDPDGVWGSKSKKGPLHLALRARPFKSDEAASSYQQQLNHWKAVVRTLIDAKADVNVQSEEYDWRGCGHTCSAFDLVIPYAIQDTHFLELFLNAGADPNTRSIHDVHSMRTDGRSDVPTLHTAVDGGNLLAVKALLDRGADADAWSLEQFFNERGFNRHTEETALHRACSSSSSGSACMEMCATLLAHGASVNAVRKKLELENSGMQSQTSDPRSANFVSSVICVPIEETALHIALLERKTELVTMLVCAGADPSLRRKRGQSTTSCEDLCQGRDDLLQALGAQWTPETHKHFPANVRASVKMAFMIAQRQNWPKTMLFKVCAMFAGPAKPDLAVLA